MIKRITAIFLAIIMYFLPWLNLPKKDIDEGNIKSKYTNVFVHGLGGWGEEAPYYDIMPYWGRFGGDLMIERRASYGHHPHGRDAGRRLLGPRL